MSFDPDVMETGESQDKRWSTSYRREIRRQQREILNDVHSKAEILFYWFLCFPIRCKCVYEKSTVHGRRAHDIKSLGLVCTCESWLHAKVLLLTWRQTMSKLAQSHNFGLRDSSRVENYSCRHNCKQPNEVNHVNLQTQLCTIL